MTDQELFLRTVEDLEMRLKFPDHYNIIRAAGLVRQLLIDSHPLAHAANRHLRIPLAFRPYAVANNVSGTRFFAAMTFEQGVKFPDTVPVKSDLFLSSICMIVDDRPYSVKEVVKCCANTRGGVHIGTPDKHEVPLIEVDMKTKANPYYLAGAGLIPISICVMAGIAHVVADGLRPLVEAITPESQSK